jgi:NAD(P)-dependent dehydrogenase (short-subunit alcohol dehydrogenase family)
MGRIRLLDVVKKYIKGLIPITIEVNNPVLAPNKMLANKVAIVTGASGGIGNATVKAMIDSGAIVIGLGRNIESLNIVKSEIANKNFIPFQCDVSDVENIEANIKEIENKIGNRNIDILINCAGVKNGNDERVWEFTPDEFSYVVDTNLKGTFFWCQKMGQYMIKRNIKGHIVNVISIKGFIGEASPYSVSKWGCTSLTKGFARLLAPMGIVVNGIAPGGTATEMAKFKEGDSMLHLATPSMRLAEPKEMANTIVFLASDFANNIIGDVIISDGGQILQYGNNRI